MYTSPSPIRTDETPSEANQQQSKATEHVGYVGFRQVFPDMQIKSSYEGQNLAKPYIPYINPSTENTPEPLSEADAEQKNVNEKPCIDPTCTSKPKEEWEEFIL